MNGFYFRKEMWAPGRKNASDERPDARQLITKFLKSSRQKKQIEVRIKVRKPWNAVVEWKETQQVAWIL